ncbi:MAG: hypothetical protein R3F20_13195 [Planctomycetota bacterium]
MRILAISLGLVLAAAAALPGQDALPVAYVNDSTGDHLWRCEDLDCDGDYDDAGECVRYFDSAIGGLLLDNNVSVVTDASGAVFASSLNSDVIVKLVDLNGDGDANDAGESMIAFDGTPGGNLSAIQLFTANGLWIDDQGILWVAHADAGAGGVDAIYRLEDLNADGDFNDAAEGKLWYAPPTAGSIGDSIPGAVRKGNDGAIYYLEVGSTGLYAKGIYRLDDANGDGSIDPLTEVAPFFLPSVPVGGSNIFFWGFTQAADDTFFMADTLNERVLRFRDDDGSLLVDEATESNVWWTAAGSSNIWNVVVDAFGNVYCPEDQTPDRILVLQDENGDGMVDASETDTVYDDTVATDDIAKPRGITIVPLPPRYAGNGTDLETRVSVNGRASEATSNVHCVQAADILTFEFVSPGGTRNGEGFAAVAQLQVSGSPPAPLQLDPLDAAPSVYLDLSQALTIVFDGLNPSPGALFAPVVGPWQYTAALPAGLSGLGFSIMVEIFVHDAALNGVGIGNAPSTEIRIL